MDQKLGHSRLSRPRFCSSNSPRALKTNAEKRPVQPPLAVVAGGLVQEPEHPVGGVDQDEGLVIEGDDFGLAVHWPANLLSGMRTPDSAVIVIRFPLTSTLAPQPSARQCVQPFNAGTDCGKSETRSIFSITLTVRKGIPTRPSGAGDCMHDAAVMETPSGKAATEESFPVISWWLPARLRPHVAAFYAYARTIDDIADNPYLAPRDKLPPPEPVRLGSERGRQGQSPPWAGRTTCGAAWR